MPMHRPGPGPTREDLGLHNRLESARDIWLRRRFTRYYSILVWTSVIASVVLAQGLLHVGSRDARNVLLAGLVFTILCALASAGPLVYARRKPPPPIRGLIRVSYLVTTLLAVLLVVPSDAMAAIVTDVYRSVTGESRAAIGPAFPWVVWFLLTHMLAAAILPWRPRQAFYAYAIFAGLVTPLMILSPNDSFWFRIIGITSVWLVGVPGVLISWFRHSRFARRFYWSSLSEHYVETTRELTDAQRLHDAILPSTVRDGEIEVAYAYEPMRAIGGDFLYVHDHRAGEVRQVSVVLVDVTGHGIPAALTVHRLHGELERIFGERPDAPPDHVLSQLNRYFHVALAKHSVYATALCACTSLQRGAPSRLTYASAGHPPAFRVNAAGSVDPLDSTCFVLGAAGPDDFDPDPRTLTLDSGDTVVAFTDGAFECRNDRGEMLGLDKLRGLISAHALDGDAPGGVLDAIRGARGHTPPNDDTLIVSLRIPSQRD